MKELPKVFVFICDENSRDQLELLGVDMRSFSVNKLKFKYLVINNKIMDANNPRGFYPVYQYAEKLIPINLADYLPTEQKWQDRTRGGLQFNIIREDRGDGIMSVEILKNDNTWMVEYLYQNGRYSANYHEFDLIPTDPHAQRKAEIIKQIEELQNELESLK